MPMPEAFSAAMRMASGSEPKSCMATGRSSASTTAALNTLFLTMERPSAATISVYTKEAPPDLTMNLKAGLETPAMGAATKGVLSLIPAICMQANLP